MTYNYFFLFSLGTITFLTMGCTHLKPETVVTPSEISVEDALRSVGRGLAALKHELNKSKLTTGLLVEEITLDLKLTSKATDSKTLAVDVSKILESGAAGIGGKVFGLDSVEAAEGARGSTLIIKLKNAALVEIKNPTERANQTYYTGKVDPQQREHIKERLPRATPQGGP